MVSHKHFLVLARVKLLKHIAVCTCLIIILLTASCAPSSTRGGENPRTSSTAIIKIAGSSAASPMLAALTSSYSESIPDSTFDVRSSGSGLGETQVFAGEVDLALSTLFAAPDALLPAPTDAVSNITAPVTGTAQIAPATLVRTPIALSGLAIIVHADNPITNLSLEQLQQLYSGRKTAWDGVDLDAVQLVSREEASGARTLFDERVLRGERLSLTALIAPTNTAVAEMVGANRAAIGYVDRAYVQPQTIDPRLHFVAVDGLLPQRDTITSQTYPLIYPLYLVYRTDSTTDVDAFVKWISGQRGQPIIEQFHVLPQAN